MNTPGCKHGLVLLFGLCNSCILQISSCRYCLSPICECLPRSWIILIMLTWCISTSSKKITLLLSCIIITQPRLSAPLLSKTASVQFSRSVMSYSLWPHGARRPPCPSPTPRAYSNSFPFNWRCHPTISSSVVPFSSCPQSLPASVFSNESTLHMRWPKYWSLSFSIIPSKELPGLISFRMDWLDLLAVQGLSKSLLQHHSSKASILWCSAFFTDHLSHPYMTNGKTIALTRQSFVGKVMSLLFNMPSRLV